MSFPHRLVEGYRAFLAGRLPEEQIRYRQLAEVGQSPEVMVIGCCDSRVSPEVIFDTHPGELFVLRNVANLVPAFSPDDPQPSVSAAVEFAVIALQVKHIVVLAHARCGGIRAFASQADALSPDNFIGQWTKLIAPAAASIGPPHQHDSFADYVSHLEYASAVKAVDNLRTYTCVRSALDQKRLHLHAAHFDVATGLLSLYDPDTKTFGSAAGAEHHRLFSQPRFERA